MLISYEPASTDPSSQHWQGAAAPHLLETGRTPVLLQQIAKGFVRQFLERFHAVEQEPVQSLPSLAIEYDALAPSPDFLSAILQGHGRRQLASN